MHQATNVHVMFVGVRAFDIKMPKPEPWLNPVRAMGQNTSTAVLEAVNTMTGGVFPTKDPLDAAGSCIFDDKARRRKRTSNPRSKYVDGKIEMCHI